MRFKKPSQAALVLLALLCLTFGTAAHSGTLTVLSQSRWVDVANILDGDTFKTTRGERVRLLGINTPEVAHEASPAQTMGNAASKALADLIAGQTVRLDFDTQRKDDYGRTLAQVYLRNGTWVNGEMVRSGMAHVYTFTPNLHWAEQLIQLEASARQEKLGIWRTERFSMLEANKVKAEHLGQFRVIHGQVNQPSRNGFSFKLGRLNISIPRKYRSYFRTPPDVKSGDSVVVHGVVRASSSGLYVALHSPFDMEKISP
ncbi:MAG: nuclease [Zetaproteobacteria bacterium CG1_02_55_237]|nr:MAG: nuclease [Zetaproteobacteria bacterium CG1_02_55_237]